MTPPRKTGSGRLMVDTGEWQAFKDDVVDEVTAKMLHETQDEDSAPTPALRTVDSSEYIRAIANEVYAGKQRECLTTGPVGQLTHELHELRVEMKAVKEQVDDVQVDLQTTSKVKEAQERNFTRRLTLIVGGFTVAGVFGNLLNIIWTMTHRGH